jgi:NAD(P)-dependent dehydrogenase (short-subunit alcohol dehydrogenase family)
METESKIDILIHNAGVCATFRNEKTVDNIEMTMQVNYYSAFLLTHLLIDLMKQSSPSKIITVSSKAHSVSYLDPTNPRLLNPRKCWLPTFMYANSKFACFLFTYELSKRLNGSGVTANILHPGTCDSNIWKKENLPFPINFYIYMTRKFLKTNEQGIQTILHVALSKDAENVSGRYFRDCKERKSSKGTYNEKWQKIMWEESKKLVKITASDPQI